MSHFISFLIYSHTYLDYFIDCLFSVYYSFQKQSVSKPENLLVIESASTIARKIREKSITSEEVVKVFIERIKEVNPLINAVTDSRFTDALNEAKEIDRDIASGKINQEDFKEKPFLGVPFMAKDTIACQGLKNTFGVLQRKDFVAEYDADTIILLKASGAILLGVANVSQLDLWQETRNPVFGVTNNPYNTTRTVGGSSGGGAAITAACGVPFGIGTDVGGSLRIPAFMCGIFGHKPTNGLVSTKGIMHRTGEEGSTMVTIGTFSKHTEDIIPILKVLLGPNINQLKLDENVNLKNLQIYYMLACKDWKVSPLGREMRQVMSRTINYFKAILNKPPEELNAPNIRYGGNVWRYWMTQEARVKFNKRPTELTARAFRSRYTVGTIMNLLNQCLPRENPEWAIKLTEQLRGEIITKLGSNGVLLYPSAPWSARHHNTAILRPWNFYYCAVWNALKLPVTQVPLGLDNKGLPIGIQVVAGPFQDHLCIAVAKELEKGFGGYVPPFIVEKESSSSDFLNI